MRKNKLPRAILSLRGPLTGFLLVFTAITLAFSWLSPFLVSSAAAAQITDRALTIGSGVPSKTGVTYTFTFTTATSGFHLDAIKLIACTTAIGSYPGGSCTAPPGLSFASATFGSISGFTDSTVFTVDASGSNDCIATAHPEVLCLKRTSSSNDTAGAKTVVINAVTNPSTTNSSFYVGITTYNANTWPSGGRQDAGTTASAVVQTLGTYAAVAEILQFCVGATGVNDTTTAVASDCSALSGTSLNLGTLDSSLITISPVSTNGGDSNNGVAMVRSNAGNGVVLEYDAIQQSGTNHVGTLRVSGATCSASSGPGTGSPPAASGPFTDPCIDAAGGTQNTFSAGSEEFGMTIAGINSGSTSSYSCTYGSPPGNTCNLEPQTGYLGAGTSGSSETFGTAHGFAWDESGTAVPIASSASSTVKQVDDEALILAFAATPSITTPFGSYVAQTDFIAVPTY